MIWTKGCKVWKELLMEDGVCWFGGGGGGKVGRVRWYIGMGV